MSVPVKMPWSTESEGGHGEEVEPPPPRRAEAPARPGRHEDDDGEVHRRDAERDRDRPEPCVQRHQHVEGVHRHEAIHQDSADVHGEQDERHRRHELVNAHRGRLGDASAEHGGRPDEPPATERKSIA